VKYLPALCHKIKHSDIKTWATEKWTPCYRRSKSTIWKYGKLWHVLSYCIL